MTSRADDARPNFRRGRSWKPLSAEQVRRHAFRVAILAWRRYRTDDVDSYLDLVADEIEHWPNAYAAAVDEINRLRNYYREHDVDAATAPAQQVASEAVTVLACAQAEADRLVDDAQARAQAMQADARAHGEAIVAHAQQEAQRVFQASRAQAEDGQIAEQAQVERLTHMCRSLIAVLGAANSQLDGTSTHLRAVADTCTQDLANLVGPAGGGPYIGRASSYETPASGV